MGRSPGPQRPLEAAERAWTPNGLLKNSALVPVPAATESQRATIRDLGAQLDAHRTERLGEHEDLTMTVLWNVPKKERRALNRDDPQGAREDLDESTRTIHEQGLVGVLREPHDWPSGLTPRVQAVRAVMTQAGAPLTVEPVAQHVHRALSEVKTCFRSVPAGPTCANCWRRSRRWGTWRRPTTGRTPRMPPDTTRAAASHGANVSWSSSIKRERHPRVPVLCLHFSDERSQLHGR